jgi:hypothetical protein
MTRKNLCSIDILNVVMYTVNTEWILGSTIVCVRIGRVEKRNRVHGLHKVEQVHTQEVSNELAVVSR